MKKSLNKSEGKRAKKRETEREKRESVCEREKRESVCVLYSITTLLIQSFTAV